MGSVLSSVTAQDVESWSAGSRFPAHTGDTLNVVDVLRLGAAKFDVLALHGKAALFVAQGGGVRPP